MGGRLFQILRTMTKHALDVWSSLNWGNIREQVIAGIILLLIPVIVGLIYKKRTRILLVFKKLKLAIFPVTFNIAFSIESEAGINTGTYYSEIKRNIGTRLRLTDLEGSIKIHDFSDIKRFESKKEAEEFRNNKDIDLIIWGSFSDDRLKERGESSSRINLYFTFGHPENNEKRIGPMLLLDINSKLATKNYWNIIESESKNDVDVISNNIFDISTYILALTLKIYGHIQKSLHLYEELAKSLKNRNDPFIKHVIPHLINNYNLLSLENYYRKRFFEATQFSEKVLEYDTNNSQALSNLALFYYKLNKKEKSQELIEKLYSLYPLYALTELNVGFLRILQKKYSNALKHYKKFLILNETNFSLPEVVDFLSEEYKTSKEPALLFASAVVSMKYGDLILATQDYNEFIKLSQNKDQFKAMRSTAIRLAGQCERKITEF